MRGGLWSGGSRSRPLAGLIVVLLACAVLGGIGLGVEDKLDPFSLNVPGTSADKGELLASSHFGDSSPFVVLLQGPRHALDRQGVSLVRDLRRDPKATVISPWDRGSVAGLRPSARKALVLVDFQVPLDESMRDTVPRLDRILETQIHAPIEATQSGFATVARALQDESLSATERAELLAAPLLILILLFVFRSVAAAAIPLVFGALTVLAGRGVLALLSSVMTIDALSLVVCTMMGLALGVDYSLLIVSRFREELDKAEDPWKAAAATRESAGRTTLFAGVTLIVAVVFSAFLQPGSLLLSLATTVGVVAAISIAVSTLAVPPLLALLGRRINAGRIGKPRSNRRRSTIAAAATAALRKPARAALLVSVPLVLLALPNIAFTTGPPGIQELSASNPAREDSEKIDQAVGPGWGAPFILVAATEQGPITTSAKLALLARWQRRIAHQPGVRAVIGPAPIARRTAPLQLLGAGVAFGLRSLLPQIQKSELPRARQLAIRLERAAADDSALTSAANQARVLAGTIAADSNEVSAVARPLSRGIGRLRRESPQLFDSGYFVLSALDGASPENRAAAAEAISLKDGGQAARMLVVSTYGFNTTGSREIGDRLLIEAKRLGQEGGLRTGVTGGAATFNAYGEATEARLPFVLGAFVLFTLFALIVILRAPLLALLAVCLNIASVAAAIGVMTLVCQVPAGYPLGGHPYVDTVGAGAIFGVTFGLSIDYAVFLIARMRERYIVDGDNRGAIEFGLEKTAGVITGAAAIMAAVFVSFAGAPIATVSQMGVGLTVAILLDATVVRIVLLPALMLLIGDRVWHVPQWLARILPSRTLLDGGRAPTKLSR
jgi:uncharacterized membrane protein YdfJ with MMPL/SSD domain